MDAPHTDLGGRDSRTAGSYLGWLTKDCNQSRQIFALQGDIGDEGPFQRLSPIYLYNKDSSHVSE
jgi:hypothetical protein